MVNYGRTRAEVQPTLWLERRKKKKKKSNHKLWAARDRPWVEFTGGEDNRSPLTNQDGKHLKL